MARRWRVSQLRYCGALHSRPGKSEWELTCYALCFPPCLAQTGSKEDKPCSGRGLCDVATGLCHCYTGYVTSDGRGKGLKEMVTVSCPPQALTPAVMFAMLAQARLATVAIAATPTRLSPPAQAPQSAVGMACARTIPSTSAPVPRAGWVATATSVRVYPAAPRVLVASGCCCS